MVPFPIVPFHLADLLRSILPAPFAQIGATIRGAVQAREAAASKMRPFLRGTKA